MADAGNKRRYVFTSELPPEAREKRRAARRRYYAAWKRRDPEAVKAAKRRSYERGGKDACARYRAQNGDKRRESVARYREQHPDRVRDSYLRQHFGIGLLDYNALLDRQNGSCAACRGGERRTHWRTQRPFALAVDHSHSTGRVRGLLRASCNTAIGLFDDDVERMIAAAAYLEEHS
jgi:hypothetical protein